jgi:predicted Fe-S protein YdhL (DUF1289 family)
MIINSNIQSPCIDYCRLDEKDICKGCHRSLNEITNWSDSSDLVKSKILKQCELRKNSHHQLLKIS